MPDQSYDQTGLDRETERDTTNRALCEFLRGERDLATVVPRARDPSDDLALGHLQPGCRVADKQAKRRQPAATIQWYCSVNSTATGQRFAPAFSEVDTSGPVFPLFRPVRPWLKY